MCVYHYSSISIVRWINIYYISNLLILLLSLLIFLKIIKTVEICSYWQCLNWFSLVLCDSFFLVFFKRFLFEHWKINYLHYNSRMRCSIDLFVSRSTWNARRILLPRRKPHVRIQNRRMYFDSLIIECKLTMTTPLALNVHVFHIITATGAAGKGKLACKNITREL